MKYEIINTRGKKRIGQWNEEGLLFMSERGNIDWNQYNESWKPSDRTEVPKQLNVYNPILLIDTEVKLIDGSRTIIIMPLRIDKITIDKIKFTPFYGRLLFWECTRNGIIKGRNEIAYQYDNNNYNQVLKDYSKLKICRVCLGIDSNICHKCR